MQDVQNHSPLSHHVRFLNENSPINSVALESPDASSHSTRDPFSASPSTSSSTKRTTRFGFLKKLVQRVSFPQPRVAAHQTNTMWSKRFMNLLGRWSRVEVLNVSPPPRFSGHARKLATFMRHVKLEKHHIERDLQTLALKSKVDSDRLKLSLDQLQGYSIHLSESEVGISEFEKSEFIRKRTKSVLKLFNELRKIDPSMSHKEAATYFIDEILPLFKLDTTPADGVSSMKGELRNQLLDGLEQQIHDKLYLDGIHQWMGGLDTVVDDYIEEIQAKELPLLFTDFAFDATSNDWRVDLRQKAQSKKTSPALKQAAQYVGETRNHFIERQALKLLSVYQSRSECHLPDKSKRNLLSFIEWVRVKYDKEILASTLSGHAKELSNQLVHEIIDRAEHKLVEQLQQSDQASMDVSKPVESERRALRNVVPLAVKALQIAIGVRHEPEEASILEQLDQAQFDLFVAQHTTTDKSHVEPLKRIQTALYMMKLMINGVEKLKSLGVDLSELKQLEITVPFLQDKPFNVEGFLEWVLETHNSLDKNLHFFGLFYLISKTSLYRMLPIDKVVKALPELQPIIRQLLMYQNLLTFDFLSEKRAAAAEVRTVPSFIELNEEVGDSLRDDLDGKASERPRLSRHKGEEVELSKPNLFKRIRYGNKRELRAVIQLAKLAADVLLEASEEKVGAAVLKAEKLVEQAIKENAGRQYRSSRQGIAISKKLHMMKTVVHLLKWAHTNQVFDNHELVSFMKKLFKQQKSPTLYKRVQKMIMRPLIDVALYEPIKKVSAGAFLALMGLAYRLSK